MAISVAAAAVGHAGVRMTTGTISFDSSYDAGGEPVTPAQFGAGQDGIPNQLPDFVVFTFTSKAGGAGTTVAPFAYFDKVNSLIHVYGGAVTGQQGIAEVAGATSYASAKASFLAFWLSPGPTFTVV